MTIVAMTDGSERSLRALPHAAALARAGGLDLQLIRILNSRTDVSSEVDVSLDAAVARVAERWKAEMREAVAAADVAAEVDVATMQRGEDVKDAVRRVAEERDALLIAIGTHGVGMLRHAALGSVAMGVVGSAKLPVMVVSGDTGPPAGDQAYRLAVTNDGSPAAREILMALRPLLERTAFPVTLVRIYTQRIADSGDRVEVARDREELEALGAELVPADVPVDIVVEASRDLESIEGAIVQAAEAAGASAIAMSTYGHSARRHLLAGSVALGVLRHSKLPLILARGR